MELSISPHQLRADPGIAERRQATCRDWIQELHLKQLFAKLSQVRRAVVDEGSQRGFAGIQIGVLVERNFLHLVESAAVSKEHAEDARAVAQPRIARMSQPLGECVPRSGL